MGTLGVQEIRIPESGTLLPGSAVAGLLGILTPNYSSQSLKGYIEKVAFNYTTASGTGSLFLHISGTGEKIGQNLGSVNNTVVYPRIFPVDNVGGTGSPSIMERYVVNGPVYLVGSSLGSPSTVSATVTFVTP